MSVLNEAMSQVRGIVRRVHSPSAGVRGQQMTGWFDPSAATCCCSPTRWRSIRAPMSFV